MKIEEHHEQAAAVLCLGGTMKAAADAAGVSVRTIQYWKEDDDFRRLIVSGKDEAAHARAGVMTPLVLQLANAISGTIELIQASDRDEEAATLLRSNLREYLSALEKLVKLEREDAAANAFGKKVREGSLNRADAREPGTIPPGSFAHDGVAMPSLDVSSREPRES